MTATLEEEQVDSELHLWGRSMPGGSVSLSDCIADTVSVGARVCKYMIINVLTGNERVFMAWLHRHVVFSMPRQLRPPFRRLRELLRDLNAARPDLARQRDGRIDQLVFGS